MPDAIRPDPDALLAKMRAEDAPRPGKLRIYFGANAGVGKTWAMLSAAHREQTTGQDVVIGVIETHGRKETAALVDGLEAIALKNVEYRGRVLAEFDLDAALMRKPSVLLVDELAHTNVPGSRHAKRFQDVQELLAAGIDVWTAINVQHLESLNGTVGAITGVRVHETVPDTVLDEADEVVLVDVTPDELTARLAAGKVYLPKQAERAAQNFFRKGNLIALREIALRRTAEHVEDDVRGWRVEQSGLQGGSGPQAWNTSGSLLACVGPHEGAAQTVRTAARLAGQLNVTWHAAYVETPRLQRLKPLRRDKILSVLKLAEELGAATSVLSGADVATELASHAQRLNCATLVIGRAEGSTGWLGWWPSIALTRALARRAPGVDIVEVARVQHSRALGSANSSAGHSSGALDVAEHPHAAWVSYALTLGITVGITLLARPLSNVLELTNIVMIFLVGVVGVAMRFGRGPAAFAALVNVATVDFFFIPPRLSFAVSDVQYLVTFAVMLGVGLLVGQLTAGFRYAAGVSASRERRAQTLFELTRELSAALEASRVATLGAAAVRGYFGGQAVVITTDERDQLVMPDPLPPNFEASVADWAFRHDQAAGLATSTLAAQPWHYVPLKAPMRVRGVLALEPAQPRWLWIPEQAKHIETLARQIAIALERVHYVDVAQGAVVEMESERLRNALLGAISHDVRTPLTALIGLAESMQSLPVPEDSSDVSVSPYRMAANAIVAQARELHALVSNLLDMARLESGISGAPVNLRRDWQSVEEVVGGAIRGVRTQLSGVEIRTDIPSNLPLVEFDAVLLERVLVNLIENAAKYGRPPITISASVTPQTLEVSVLDHGDGLPVSMKGQEQKLFEKFTRGKAESTTPGVGLGLAICKAIVSAHGGEITAHNAPNGGAEFVVTLPRRSPPAIPNELQPEA